MKHTIDIETCVSIDDLEQILPKMKELQNEETS